MSSTLVLFCGGPAIYRNLPKPLQTLHTGETLLERYLKHIEPNAPKRIILLVDQFFEKNFLDIIINIDYLSDISIITCPDHCSTFTKLQVMMENCPITEGSIMLSYPDIFVFEKLQVPMTDDPYLHEKVFISNVAISSRFPRLVVDPYVGKVRGISKHISAMPSNPLHIYGGHLIARIELLRNLIKEFLSEVSIEEPSLEFDLFFWLINTNRMLSFPIYGQWIQADSPREIEELIRLT